MRPSTNKPPVHSRGVYWRYLATNILFHWWFWTILSTPFHLPALSSRQPIWPSFTHSLTHSLARSLPHSLTLPGIAGQEGSSLSWRAFDGDPKGIERQVHANPPVLHGRGIGHENALQNIMSLVVHHFVIVNKVWLLSVHLLLGTFMRAWSSGSSAMGVVLQSMMFRRRKRKQFWLYLFWLGYLGSNMEWCC